MDITTSWKDKRLQYEAEPPDTTIVLQNTGGTSIWRPDLIVISEKGVKYKTFPETLAACRISPSGDVLFSQRYMEILMTLKFSHRYGNSSPIFYISHGHSSPAGHGTLYLGTLNFPFLSFCYL